MNDNYNDNGNENDNDTGWQKLCEGTKGLCRKVWTQAKNFKP